MPVECCGIQAWTCATACSTCGPVGFTFGRAVHLISGQAWPRLRKPVGCWATLLWQQLVVRFIDDGWDSELA